MGVFSEENVRTGGGVVILLTVRDQLCHIIYVPLWMIHVIQSQARKKSYSQSAAHSQMMSHQEAQKGWHISGLWHVAKRPIIGLSQYFGREKFKVNYLIGLNWVVKISQF